MDGKRNNKAALEQDRGSAINLTKDKPAREVRRE